MRLETRSRIARGLQFAYNGNRPPTWGCKETSAHFFDTWAKDGLTAAIREQTENSRDIGDNPAARAMAAILGSGLYVGAKMLERKSAVRKETPTLPARRALRYALPIAVALPLLRYGCGESVTIEGRSEPGTTYDSNQNTTVHLTGAEAREYNEWLKAHSAFTPKSTVRPCEMEAYNQYYSERKEKRKK